MRFVMMMVNIITNIGFSLGNSWDSNIILVFKFIVFITPCKVIVADAIGVYIPMELTILHDMIKVSSRNASLPLSFW